MMGSRTRELLEAIELFLIANQIEAMVNSGRLTAEEAQPLIDSANAAIELIEAEP